MTKSVIGLPPARHDHQRLRPLQSRHRAVELAHGGTDARRGHVRRLARAGRGGGRDRVAGIRAELFGSLGATGHGHGSVKAIVLGPVRGATGNGGPRPRARTGRQRQRGRQAAACPPPRDPIRFDPGEDIVLHRRKRLPIPLQRDGASGRRTERARCGRRGPTTRSGAGSCSARTRDGGDRDRRRQDATTVPYPFLTGAELLAQTHRKPGCPSAAS